MSIDMLNENIDEIAPEQYKKFVAKALDKAHGYAAQLDMFAWLRDRNKKRMRLEEGDPAATFGAPHGAGMLRLHPEETKTNEG